MTRSERGEAIMRKAHFELRALTSFVFRAAGALLLWSCATAYAAGPAKGQPPVVTLTSPTVTDSFIAPGTIPLAATASDPDGTIIRVDFFQGSTLIGSSTTAPYTASWSNVPIGTYSITAKATDNSGSTATSAPVSVTVNSATSLVITSPADGSSCQLIYTCGPAVTGTFESSFATGNTILIDVDGFSSHATISGNSFSTFVQGPTVPGPTTITARLARPDRTFVKRSITIFAYLAPIVVFTAPSSATFNEPATVTFVADAKAPGGTVKKVSFYYHNSLDFFRDPILFGTVTSPPYQIALPNLAKGTYTISAVATNDHGVGGSTIQTITVVGPNVPPSISITSPASGAVFNAPASVPVNVNATDSDGTVTLVELFGDGALLGASNSAPFSFTWSNVALGAHTITARATDNQGAQTTSAPVSITVNNPPTATLTSPLQGASFLAGSSITLTANASDTDGTIARVEFYQGTTLIGTATTAPYSVNWSVTAPGTYTLTVKAFDNLGGVGTSTATITVTGPQISITSPGSGATFAAPATVALSAKATDDDGGTITKVEFYQGTILIGTVTAAPYTFNWNNVGAGAYALTAKATDSLGASTISAAVSITVSGPQVSLTSPTTGASFTAPATITLTANATQIGAGTIAKVEFYQGTTLIGTIIAAPYTFSWTNVAVGTYTLTAKATDSLGASSISAGVTVSVTSLFTITSPANGATVDDDRVLVTGQVVGPQYAGVKVNGVVAFVDSNRNFYANNVHLSTGSNTITATLTAVDGTTTSQSISVSSTGPAPIRIDADPLEAGVPLSVAFKITTTGGASFTRADYDFTGDGVVDYTLNPPGGTLTATYSVAGVYTPIVTATDSFGRVVQRRFAVLADPNPDVKLRGTFNAMLDSLRAGDVDGALQFITGGASAQYAALFNGLKQAGKLTDAVNALGTLRGSTVGPDFGEVILTRDTPSGTVAFPIWFLRGPDGVWRIEGM